MIERSALDAARVIDALHGGAFTRVDRLAGLIAKREPDVPFADRCGGVALLLQHPWQRELSGCDQRRPARALKHRAAIRHAKRHLPRHETVARRCANGGRAVCIGEHHAFARELVDVRRRNLRIGVVATHIAIAEVVSEDEKDIRRSRKCRMMNGECRKKQKEESHGHFEVPQSLVSSANISGSCFWSSSFVKG